MLNSDESEKKKNKKIKDGMIPPNLQIAAQIDQYK